MTVPREAPPPDCCAILESLPDAAYAVDGKGNVIAWNAAMAELTSQPAGLVLGRPAREVAVMIQGRPWPLLADLLDTDDVTIEQCFERVERTNGTVRGEMSADWLGGATIAIAAAPIIQDGRRAGAVTTIRDITLYHEAEDQLAFLDSRDPMTGLFNRPHFERELRRLETAGAAPLAIIFCDIDGLKLYNDMAGHLVGDLVLLAASDIVKLAFRRGGQVARIDGDGFAIILSPGDEESAEDTCHAIRQAVIDYNKAAPERQLSLSLGWAVRRDTRTTLTDVCNEADASLYREKLNRSQSARSAIVRTLLRALSARDGTTGGHARRLQSLITLAAVALGLPERSQTNLRLLAQFHDIGKVGVPDRVLLKRGPLEGDEIAEMRSHCDIGSRIAQTVPELAQISDWILKHHERWDGTGYPLGLKGEAIPVEIRLMAIVDAYDAMVSDRPYRKALCHEDAVAELAAGSGTQFDPDLVPFFIDFINQQHIRQRLLADD